MSREQPGVSGYRQIWSLRENLAEGEQHLQLSPRDFTVLEERQEKQREAVYPPVAPSDDAALQHLCASVVQAPLSQVGGGEEGSQDSPGSKDGDTDKVFKPAERT